MFVSCNFEKDLIYNSYLPTYVNMQTQKLIFSQFVET